MSVMDVRTRFAPSPTGTLHIGNVRTALFAWLYARKHNGQFILRIEDTDTERSTEASVRNILAELEWLGLNYDEGPFFQSRRQTLYKETADRLLAEGKAYYCYCTKEELAKRAAGFSSKGFAAWGYDGKCRNRTAPRAGIEPTIRIKNPNSGISSFEDGVHGLKEMDNEQLSDIVIVRANGMPTYNFAAAVDDIDMRITHILRGDDHLHNTFQQINIIRHLNATPPTYTHLPMVLGEDGHRLSKREQAAAIADYRKQGYLPHAMLNYLARLGWSRGDQEIFSNAELIKYFNLSAIHKSCASLNRQKLDWLNAHYLAEMPIAELTRAVENYLKEKGVDTGQTVSLSEVITEMRSRYKTISALATGLLFIYEDLNYDADLAQNYRNHDTVELLKALLIYTQEIEDWDDATLKTALSDFVAEQDIKMATIAKPLRFVLTAGAPSPALAQVMAWIGKERCVARIKQFA